MRQVGFRETEEWAKGRKGERLVAGLLQRAGWYVVPSYDYAGEEKDKAPRLQGARAEYVIPDLDIARNGKRLWAEVKTKSAPTLTRSTGKLEHGMSLRHYNHYQKVQQITGCEVWIFIHELTSGAVLYARLDDLRPHMRTYGGKAMGNAGMVFWPRDAFRVWSLFGEQN